MGRQSRLGAAVAAVLGAACFGASQPPRGLTDAGLIEGRVSDAERARPIWRANVYIRPLADTVVYEAPGAPEDGARNMYTDSTGAFSLRGVLPGEYRLTARFPGYEDLRTAVRVRPGQVTRQDAPLRPLETGY